MKLENPSSLVKNATDPDNDVRIILPLHVQYKIFETEISTKNYYQDVMKEKDPNLMKRNFMLKENNFSTLIDF